MKLYFIYLMCLGIFTLFAMDSDHASKLKKELPKELQQAIEEDSLENFLSYISTNTGKNRLKAFRTAVIQKAHAITHNIPTDLKDQLLVLAARHGSQTVARFLTRLNTYQYSPITDYAFFEALKTQHLKIAKLLLDKGANINHRVKDGVCDQVTLLHHFILDDFNDNNFAIIKWLLDQGADPDLVSSESDVPLQDAEDELPIVELLCDHGADPNKRDDVGDITLINFCGIFLHNEEIQIMIQLLKAGTDINAKNSQGRTFLHKATQANNITAALILLHHGASKEIIDKNEKFPGDYIHTHEMRILFNSPTLPPLPKAVQNAQLAIQKKKIKLL